MKTDCAMVRARATSEDQGDAGTADRTVAADHEVASVRNIGAWVKVEGGSPGYLDSTAIDAWRNGFCSLLVQPVMGSRASGKSGDFETGVRIGDGRGVGRQVPRGGHNRAGRECVAAQEEDVSGAETRAT